MRGWLAIAGALMAVLGTAPTAAAQPSPEAIRAAFVYNFARFTRWPANAFNGADAPLVVCVSRDARLAAALREIDGKAVGDRALRVADGDDARCHIRIVDAAAAPTPESAVLTVSETPGFVDRGGAIGIVQVGRQVRFEVNVSEIERAGLTVSSKLLRLALGIRR